MSPKIIIQGGNLYNNEGDAAMSIATIRMVEEACPDAKIFYIARDANKSNAIIKELQLPVTAINVENSGSKLQVLKAFLLSRLLSIHSKKYTKKQLPQLFFESNLVIDISGDMISEVYGQHDCYYQLVRLCAPIFYKAPLLIFPQSIGPFNNLKTRLMTKLIFNYSASVVAREDISFSYLKKMHVKKLYPKVLHDTAFFLASSNKLLSTNINTISKSKKLFETSSVIAFSISQSIARFTRKDDEEKLFKKYMDLMYKAIEYCIEALNTNVILIAHVKGPRERHDDRIACKRIFYQFKNCQKVHYFDEDCNAMNLKWIISKCELMIGARMHANIAALSSCVPTIAIGYSYKFRGIMRLMDQEIYSLDITTLTLNSLISAIHDIWINKKFVRSNLRLQSNLIENSRRELIKLITKSVR